MYTVAMSEISENANRMSVISVEMCAKWGEQS